MKSMSFTVFSYNATVLLIQLNSTQPSPSHVLENATQPNPTQPMDGPNPCPSLTPPVIAGVFVGMPSCANK